MTNTSGIDVPTVREFSTIAAESDPTRVAFGAGPDGRTVTWREFEDASRRAGHAFADHAAQGDRVAFLCENSLDHVTLWNGAVKAGCVVSNLHHGAAPATIRSCIDDLRPRVLVVDEAFAEFVAEDVLPEITTDPSAVVTIGSATELSGPSMAAFVADRPTTPLDVRVRERDVAAVVWTSGTTGPPKGWCHTHRGLVLRSFKLATKGGTDRNSRIPHVFTPSFAAWYAVTLPAMFTRAATYFVSDWDPAAYLRTIEARRLTTALLVPTMWRELLDTPDLDAYDLDSLRYVESAGERLGERTLDRLRERICERVYNSYGTTEVVVSSLTAAEQDPERIGSVGKPHPGTRVRIVDPDGTPDDTLPPGEVGEIVVRGADSAVWIWGDTGRTADAFDDGWWRSGDLGYRDADGYLFLQGRADFVIKSKGVKVTPTRLEDHIGAHPGVAEVAVVGVDDPEYGQKVTAVVRRSDPSVTAEDLDEWCLAGDAVGRRERPREYRFTEEPLPRTASGKLDRRAARERTA